MQGTSMMWCDDWRRHAGLPALRGHQMLVTNTYTNKELSYTRIQDVALLLRSSRCPVNVAWLAQTKSGGGGKGGC